MTSGGGWPFWQAGLRLRRCRGHLSLPRGREADVPHDVRAGWQDDAALLDERLPELPGAVECTTGNERRIPRWEHEHILEAAQRRLDENPQAMRERRETVEHPFGTLKMRMGSTHFLMKRLPKIATEMALHVLAYNITRVMNIMGVEPLIAAMRV
jgi:Transposase DDE domain